MLHNHEYDPNCKFCADNKFVKDAKKATALLPAVEAEAVTVEDAIVSHKKKMKGIDMDKTIDVINRITDSRQTMERLSVEIGMVQVSMEGARSKISLLENEVRELERKEKEYEENKETIENLSTLMREKKAMQKSLINIKEQLERCNDKTQALLIEKGSANTSVERYEQEQKEFVALEKEWKTSELFMRCMHPNGIAYEVIKQRLPLINEEVAKILANIVEFNVLFENNDKKLEIFIKHPKYEPRPLSMGSGAEKTIAAMAIRLALISITNLPKSELFILDEPATALDQEHMEGFTRLLEMIKTKFRTVLLISHLDVLKDCVDTTIDIDRKGGYAKVSIK
jgi:exonuclease SbcC